MKTYSLLSLAFILGCLLASLVGCTDAGQARFFALGQKHRVELYSGGQLVRSWTSTGKVFSEENSDGYYFMDQDTGVLVRVTGDLVVTPITGDK